MTDTPCDLLKERWYVVGPPWGDGTFIRARAEDAAGIYVCGIEDVDWDDRAQDPADVLSYICQIHNAKLREPIRQLALADARADKAEHELAHLRKAYDLLFETHQREMDRLNAKVAELERECNTYAERDLMIEAVLATNGRVEGMDGPRGQVAHVTIPALARVLAVLLIKPDSSLYNYIAWDVGDLPETGPLTLSLQRGNGKTPAALVLEAHAERDRAMAALRDILAGAEQQSQSHADVRATCQAVLGDTI